MLHPLIDAVIAIRNRDRIDPAAVSEIALRVNPLVLSITGVVDPSTGLQSKFSTLHSAAVALIDGAAGTAQYSDAKATDPAVAALRRKVKAVADETLRKDEAHAAIVAGGKRHEVHIAHASGTAENPMSDAQIEAKFLANATPVIGAEQCAARGGVDRFAGEAGGHARTDRAAGLISARAVDHVVQRHAALETLDLRDDMRGEHARRNVAGVVRRDRDLGMSPQRAFRRQRLLRENVERAPASVPSSSAATMSASTCNGPRPALMRNAPPAAPSRLSLRNSARFRIPSVSRVRGSRQTRISVRARKASRPALP